MLAWDPPHHFSVRAEGPDGWFNQLDYRIEARGDGAILRYVHSGVFDDAGWDNQYDAVNSHTDFYLHTLGQYLEHFSPRTATYVGGGAGGLMGPEASMAPDAFTRLQAALGVPEGASAGDSVRLAHDDVDGVIDYRTDRFLGIRTGDALYRFFGRNAFGGPVGMSIHHFGDGVDADADGRRLDRVDEVRLLVPRQLDGEHRPAARGVRRSHPAAVGVDDRRDDRQPEAGPRPAALAAALRPPEALEHARRPRRRAGPGRGRGPRA